MNLDQMAQQAYQHSQTLQGMYDTDAANATNQYNQSVTGANNAQNDLSNFTKNMVSGNDTYQNQLQQANKNAGYDVNNLNQAQNQVSQISGIMGGLPRAVQAQNANYGATAGDVAGQYSTQAANLNQSLGLANQNAQNQLQKMQGGLTGAQAGTQAVLGAQDQQRQAYAATAANAIGVMQQSQTTMKNMIDAQQSNGRLTAEQQNIFAQAKANYAAAQASYAAASAASAQAEQTRFNTSQARQANDFAQAHSTGAYTLPSSTAPKTPAAQPQNSGPSIGDMWNTWNAPMSQALGSAGNFIGSLFGGR